MIPMLWPVYGFRNGMRETVAVFFDYGAAVDCVNASLGERNLYLAEPRYDNRLTAKVEQELRATMKMQRRAA